MCSLLIALGCDAGAEIAGSGDAAVASSSSALHSAGSGHDGRTVLQAEAADDRSQVTTFFFGIAADGGERIAYDHVQFGHARWSGSFVAKVATSNAGGRVVVRVGDSCSAGVVVANLELEATGSDFNTYEEQSVTLSSPVSGEVERLSICFEGGAGIGNFDWFEFRPGTAECPANRDVNWVLGSNGQLPADAWNAGTTDAPRYVCRATHQGQTRVGYMLGTACRIPAPGNQFLAIGLYEVLTSVGSEAPLEWREGTEGQVDVAVVSGGSTGAYVCGVQTEGAFFVGTLTVEGCRYGSPPGAPAQTHSMTSDYQVLKRRLGTRRVGTSWVREARGDMSATMGIVEWQFGPDVDSDATFEVGVVGLNTADEVVVRGRISRPTMAVLQLEAVLEAGGTPTTEQLDAARPTYEFWNDEGLLASYATYQMQMPEGGTSVDDLVLQDAAGNALAADALDPSTHDFYELLDYLGPNEILWLEALQESDPGSFECDALGGASSVRPLGSLSECAGEVSAVMSGLFTLGLVRTPTPTPTPTPPTETVRLARRVMDLLTQTKVGGGAGGALGAALMGLAVGSGLRVVMDLYVCMYGCPRGNIALQALLKCEPEDDSCQPEQYITNPTTGLPELRGLCTSADGVCTCVPVRKPRGRTPRDLQQSEESKAKDGENQSPNPDDMPFPVPLPEPQPQQEDECLEPETCEPPEDGEDERLVTADRREPISEPLTAGSQSRCRQRDDDCPAGTVKTQNASCVPTNAIVNHQVEGRATTDNRWYCPVDPARLTRGGPGEVSEIYHLQGDMWIGGSRLRQGLAPQVGTLTVRPTEAIGPAAYARIQWSGARTAPLTASERRWFARSVGLQAGLSRLTPGVHRVMIDNLRGDYISVTSQPDEDDTERDTTDTNGKRRRARLCSNDNNGSQTCPPGTTPNSSGTCTTDSVPECQITRSCGSVVYSDGSLESLVRPSPDCRCWYENIYGCFEVSDATVVTGWKCGASSGDLATGLTAYETCHVVGSSGGFYGPTEALYALGATLDDFTTHCTCPSGQEPLGNTCVRCPEGEVWSGSGGSPTCVPGQPFVE